MKRVLLSFVVMFVYIASVAAQGERMSNTFFEGMSTRDYNRIAVGYSPLKINWQDKQDENFKQCPLTGSISIGYVHGSNIVKSLPLFIEYGATLQYSFGKSQSKTKYGSSANYSVNTAKMFSVNVPVNVALRLGFKSNKIAIMPYAGLNLRCNIAGNIKQFKGAVISNGFSASGGSHTTTYRLLDSSDDKSAMGDKALKRFQLGINAGVGFTFGKFYVGAGYTADVTKIANNADVDYVGSLGTVNISVGLSF